MESITLVEVPESQKSVLRQLVELYEYDLSPFTGYELNEHGYYGYSYLDYYWTEKERFAYFIMLDEKIAGFVLVNDYCEASREPNAKTIAEFFVIKAFRRKSIGQHAAKSIFDLFPGAWEIHQYLDNKESVIFWEKVIGEYRSGDFEKRVMITEDGEQQVILFKNIKNQNQTAQDNPCNPPENP